MKKDYKNSAEYLKKAFDINKDSTEEGIKYYEELLGISGYGFSVFYNGAESFFLDGENEKVLEMLEKLEELELLSYQKIQAYLLKGKALIREGKEEEAVNCISTIFEWDSLNFEAHLALGEIYTDKGENEKAIFHLKKAKFVNSENFEVNKLLGRNYLKLGQYNLSIDALEKALSIREDDPEVLYSLGYAYLEKEDYTRLKNIAERILSLPLNSTKRADAYILLGLGEFYGEKYQEAISALKEALKIDSTNCDPYKILSDIYEKEGKSDSARIFSQIWKRCINKN